MMPYSTEIRLDPDQFTALLAAILLAGGFEDSVKDALDIQLKVVEAKQKIIEQMVKQVGPDAA